MKFLQYSDIWWGPPKKFSEEDDERKVSWLESLNYSWFRTLQSINKLEEYRASKK